MASDPEINEAIVRIQAVLAGTSVEVALNALAYQTGILAILGAETKGDALSCVRTSTEIARKAVTDMWGNPEIGKLRGKMRGVNVQ